MSHEDIHGCVICGQPLTLDDTAITDQNEEAHPQCLLDQWADQTEDNQ